MAVRQKQKVLDIAYAQFKKHGLALDIDYKEYAKVVGPQDALHAISVKRSFKAWKYLLHALKVKHPDLGKKPEPAPAPKPAPKAKVAPAAPSSEAAPAEEKSED
jgi:hypothetical protein